MTDTPAPPRFPVPLRGAEGTTLMWADETAVEQQALDQLHRIAGLPWLHGLRVMPDVHFGKGATVGSVIAMRDAVSPAAVGVDIGCGMSAVLTSLTASDLPDDLSRLRSRIERAVPVGFGMHRRPVDVERLGIRRDWTAFWGRFGDLHPKVLDRETKAQRQLGSLGGGNHFIEVCLDDEQRVWLMLHSGSRNIGKELADVHISTAKSLEHNLGLPDRDLAVFLAGTPEMEAYLRDLHWAQEYAARSRAVMMELLRGVVRGFYPEVAFEPEISCHHNYVAHERFDDQDLIVTRKGAIRAGSGDLGLIPGSMATGSYVVRGLGSERSFCSASHGAGRRMSRNQARRQFTVDDLAAQRRVPQGRGRHRRDPRGLQGHR